MSDTRKSVVVDIVSDSRKFLNGFEDAIKEIEKTAKKANILGGMQDDIDALKSSVKDIGSIIQNIKPSTDDSALQKLQDRIEKIGSSIESLKRDTKNIKLEVDETSGKDLEKIIDKTKSSILDTVDEMKQATAFLSDVFKIKVSNTSLDEASKKILGLKKQVEEFKTIQKTLDEEEPKGYSNAKLKDASNSFTELKSKYEQTEEAIKKLKEQIDSGVFDKADKKKLNDYTIELSLLAKELLAVQDRLYDFKSFDISQLLDDGMLEKTVNLGKQLVSNRISGIEKVIADLSGRTVNAINEEVTKLEVKDGKIRIPIDLDQTASKLKKLLNNVIDELQSTVSPVTVPIQLVSAYKTNTKKEVAELKEIQALQSGIDQLTDENQKSIAQSTLDKIKTQFQKELKLDIKTNISEAEKDINHGIKAIQKVLKDNKIYIYPEIELSEETKKKLKDELDGLTSHKISLDATGLAEQFSNIQEELAKITDTAPVINWAKVFSDMLDGICQKMKTLLASDDINNLFTASGVTELMKQLTTITQELEKIQKLSQKKGLKDSFSIGVKEEDLNKFTDSINKMASSLEQLSKIDFSMPNIEKVQDQIGATHTSSSDISQESAELTKLNKKLGEAIKRINEKNEAFLKENKIVSSVIPAETEKIGKLVSALTHVKKVLEEINGFCKELDLANLTNLGQLNKLKPDKINTISTSISSLAENINKLELKDGNILGSIQDILSKADELKDLASVLKSTSSQNSAVNGATIGAESKKAALKQGIKDVDGQATEHNKELIANYKELIKLTKDYFNLREKSANGTITDTESALLDELIQKWNEAINKKNEYEVHTNGSSKTENRAIKIQDEFISTNASAYSRLVDDYIKTIQKKLSAIDSSKFTQDFNNQLSDLMTRLQNMSTRLPLDIISDSDIKDIAVLKRDVDNILVSKNDGSNKLTDPTSVYKLQAKIAKILEQNTAMSGKLETEFKELQSVLESLGVAVPADKFKELATTFQKLESEMQKTGKTGKSFFDLITTKAKHASAQLIAQYLSLQDFIRYGREIFNTIKEYDTALTEMNKVSKESISTLKEFQKESFDLADAVGTTGKQLQQSTADWMRLGESLEEAKQSAQDANILFNVSEFDSISEATDSLVAMSQAYKDLEKGEIIDVLNNLGNNFAIGTDGLATALQNSASSLLTAQNDFYEAAALTTAANAVVQDPNKVGAGLRTIALRLTGTEAAKEELASLGEDVDDFVVTTTSKLDQQIKDLTKTQGNFGVSLLDMNGNYRSTYEVLLDIAEVWDQIAKEDLETGENRQNALLEMMAGKNRSNILASVLQSPDVLKEAYAAALDSEGSALKENEAYLESIQGHLQQIKNLWDSLWVNENNREVITFFLDAVKFILEKVNEFGALQTLLVGGGGIFAAIKTIQGDGRLKKFSLKEFKYAVCNKRPCGYTSFLIALYEIHIGKHSIWSE